MKEDNQPIPGPTSGNPQSTGDSPTYDRELRDVLDRYVSPRRLGFKIVDLENDTLASIAFTPDGAWMVTGGRYLRLWETATGRCLWTREIESGFPMSAAISSGEKNLLAVGGYRQAWLFDLFSGRSLQAFPDHRYWVRAVAFARNEEMLITACGGVRLWDIISGRCVMTLAEGSLSVMDLAVTPSGERLATAGEDGTVRLWDPATGRCLWTYEGHNGEVFSLAVTPDGNHLISGGRDKTLRLLDITTGRRVGTLARDSFHITKVNTAEEGRLVVAKNAGRHVRIYDIANGRSINEYDHVAAVEPTPDGKSLAIANGYNVDEELLLIRDIRTRRKLQSFGSGGSRVYRPNVMAFGHTLLACVDFHPLNLFDLATGRRVAGFDGCGDLPTLVIAPGRTVSDPFGLSSGLSWNIFNGRNVFRFRHSRGSGDSIDFVSLSVDGVRLITTGYRVKIWEPATGRLLGILKADDRSLAVALTPDGRRMITVGRTAGVRLWDLTTCRCLDTLLYLTSDVRGVAIAPDCRTLAASYESRDGRLWDLKSGRLLRDCPGLKGKFVSHGLSADGRLLAITDGYHPPELWDLQTGALLHILKGHQRQVCGIDVTPDGRRIVTGSWDHTVKVWDAATGILLATYYNLDHGFLWTAPPDEAAPSGWLWTDREDMVQVFECDPDGADPAFPAPDDPRRADYLRVFNSREMITARLQNLEEYRLLAASHRGAVEANRSVSQPMLRARLPSPSCAESSASVPQRRDS